MASQHTILICDDDRDIVSALDIYLRAEGYRTLLAYSGSEAIRLAAENQTTPPHRRSAYIIKDVRLFLNSVERGIRLMQGAGVGAQVARQDTDSEICLTVRIPKTRRPAAG